MREGVEAVVLKPCWMWRKLIGRLMSLPVILLLVVARSGTLGEGGRDVM